MTALPLNLTLQTVTDFVGNNSAIQLSTLRLGIRSDSSVTTQTSSVIQATTTNANLVIAPNGTGALVASIPDGTATGGNARGTNAVDLQTSRSIANQVASGVGSSIIGGERNTASGTYSSVIGGYGVNASGPYALGGGQAITSSGANSTCLGGYLNQSTNTQSTCIGGVSNVASGFISVISGGSSNTASVGYSTVSGGQSNTASTNTYATVVGGGSNTASGQYATVVGGQSNVSSGQHSVSGGSGSVASGTRSIALGGSNNAQAEASVTLGQQNVTTQPYSFSSGYFASSYLYGQKSHQNGRFDLAGDAQQSLLTARREASLNSAAATVLSLDGTGTTNLIIPTGVNRVWNVVASWSAIVTAITGTATGVSVGDVATECNLFAFKKIAGVSSIVGTVTNVASHNDASMATAAMGYTAGASQQLIPTFSAPIFVGGGSITIRVVLKLMLTEVAY
jgi:hypothetical protein